MHRPVSTPAVIPTPAMDGARVLWRHWMRPRETAAEGWLREFSQDGRRVRICTTQTDRRERGHWHECRQIRIEDVLNPATAPDETKPEAEE